MVASRKKNVKSRSARKSRRGKRTTPRRSKRTTPRQSRRVLRAGKFNEISSVAGIAGLSMGAREKKPSEAALYGTGFYGAASGIHDIISGATALKNRFTGERTKLSFKGSAYAPLAVGAAGAAAGALLSDESTKLNNAGVLGVLGYGASSFVRDAYQAYNNKKPPPRTQPHRTDTQHTPTPHTPHNTQHTHNPRSTSL